MQIYFLLFHILILQAVSFSLNIKRLRVEKKMSQADLAKVLGVTTKSVSNYEQGISRPHLDQFVVLAKLFGVSLDSLFGYKTSPNSFIATQPVGAGAQIPDQSAWTGSGVSPISLPGIPKGSIVFQVVGESMEPTLKDGDYIVGHRLTDPTAIAHGNIHIVVTKEPVYYVKRVELSTAGLLLFSDAYPNAKPAAVPPGELDQVWLVTHLLTRRYLKQREANLEDRLLKIDNMLRSVDPTDL